MAKGTLTLGPHVWCDWITITTAQPGAETEDLNYEPVWNKQSKFLAKFDNTLRTGNLKADGTPPTSWAIYRQEVGKEAMQYVITAEGTEATCFDYAAANNTQYIYHSFARTESDMSEDKRSNTLTPNWNGWILTTIDPTDDPTLFVPHEIFCFDYNLELGDMTNNTGFNQMETFGRYPIIQRSAANHMSGQLKGLVGIMDDRCRYVETVAMADAIQALTTDTRRKILKDLKGHVWEVELSGGIIFSIEPRLAKEPYAATLQWVEVGDASDIRVVKTV